MFTGNEDQRISLEEAAAMTERYRDSVATGLPQGGFFGRDGIETILAQEGCVGIRYYNGINSKGQSVIILVGADENEDDMTTGLLLEFAIPCPTQCGVNNALNS